MSRRGKQKTKRSRKQHVGSSANWLLWSSLLFPVSQHREETPCCLRAFFIFLVYLKFPWVLIVFAVVSFALNSSTPTLRQHPESQAGSRGLFGLLLSGATSFRVKSQGPAVHPSLSLLVIQPRQS